MGKKKKKKRFGKKAGAKATAKTAAKTPKLAFYAAVGALALKYLRRKATS